jgi:hypothetical protein
MGPYYYYTFVGFIILKLFSIIWLAWFDVVHIILEYHNVLQNRNWCSVLGLYIHWFNMDFNLHLWNTFRDVHFLRVWRKWCARSHCVCLTNFIWRLTSNPKCHVTFFKTKMNVNWHLHFLLKGHLNACLVVRVISRSKMSIDALLFSAQVTLHVKILIVHVNWRAIYFGARFCVSNVKNFVKANDMFATHCSHDKCRQKFMQMTHDKTDDSLLLFILIRHFTPKKSPNY